METGGDNGADSKGRDLVGDSGWMEGKGWEGRGRGPSVPPPHQGRGGGPKVRVWVEKGRQQAWGWWGVRRVMREEGADGGARRRVMREGARGGGGKSKGVDARTSKQRPTKPGARAIGGVSERRTVK